MTEFGTSVNNSDIVIKYFESHGCNRFLLCFTSCNYEALILYISIYKDFVQHSQYCHAPGIQYLSLTVDQPAFRSAF